MWWRVVYSQLWCAPTWSMKVREFEAVCAVGGGNGESPFHCISPSKCRHGDPVRGGGVDGARAPWERCWACVRVSQRACAVPMPPPPPLPSFVLPLTLCCLVQSAPEKDPSPYVTVMSLLSWFSFYPSFTGLHQDYLDTCVLEWHWSMFFFYT